MGQEKENKVVAVGEFSVGAKLTEKKKRVGCIIGYPCGRKIT
jgi:hypothetical protein